MQVEIDDSDDKTIRFSAEPATHGTIFGGFGDFDLDLSCLSPPSSPTPSTSNLPPDTPFPPPSPILSRSTSFVSQMSSLPLKKSKKKLSSPHLSATTGSAITSRGSWPLIKYAGRGTPIDRSRRLEWGGFSGEEVAEDGLLFSTGIRSTSLYSTIRSSKRCASPEWSHVSALSSSHSRVSSESASRGNDSVHEQPPELAIEGLGADKSEEWDSIMKTVLASSSTEVPPASNASEDTLPQADSELEIDPKGKSSSVVETRFMSPEQMEQLNNGLEIDLGLNAALDLGLGQKGGMNWFDLGVLPQSANGRNTPAPRPSPPPSVRASEHRSTMSTNDSGDGGGIRVSNSGSHHPWWRRFLLRFRRVQSLITIHKSRF
jgi:hypothetical protein